MHWSSQVIITAWENRKITIKNNKPQPHYICRGQHVIGGKKIKSIRRPKTKGSTILSTSPLPQRMMKQPGKSQWHWQRNKSKLASEIVRLRIWINRSLESRNGETIKETKFRRPAKIGVKTNMTSAKNNGHAENKIKLHRKDNAFQSRNDER